LEWTPIRGFRQWLAGETDRDAITIARTACAAEKWPWLEPVRVESMGLHWVVTTSYDMSGRNARIVVSKRTGEVICKSFLRRMTTP
jgi:hypothetical protein